MPDVSSYEATIQSIKDGSIPTLGVSIDSKTINLGTKLTKKETQSTPTLTLPSSFGEGTYTVIALDIDAPFVSLNFLSPIVHWMQTDLEPSTTQDESSEVGLKLETSEPPVIPWLPAGPPPGAAPHRYVFLLYKQEKEVNSELKGRGIGKLARMRFDLSKMLGELGLAGRVVAGNWFVAN
ncbi:YbhB/YbcL family Raf kinase inhibitor-like protein [Aspergillus stella-maris]|uniref:YbhB/YbcL family Raf kinase inhibitor-like protein n=1 Tax=Aspergillus stella-maris TaxID=1810926 RepID=UPI003CCCA005